MLRKKVSYSTSTLARLSIGLFLFVFLAVMVGDSSCTKAQEEDQECVKLQTHPQHKDLLLYHFASTESTQNEAKKLAESGDIDATASFCVTATEQTKGRGTSGRDWMGAKGNTFVTIGIPQTIWLSWRHVPLTLLPLKIGTLVAQHVQGLLKDCKPIEKPKVTVKWPNDVLVNEKKISGILIESSSNGWFLIGIGVNLAYGPSVPIEGPNYGRPSTSMNEYCPQLSNWEHTAQQLGIDLAKDLHQFMATTPNPQMILQEWKAFVNWNMELILRDTPQRERVKLVDVLADGRVQVMNSQTGHSRTLVADYFF